MQAPAERLVGKLEFLKHVRLFSTVSAEGLIRLARASALRAVPRGTSLFTQTDAAMAFYVVRSGAIAILLTSVDGRELVINEMRAGDCFGELALLTGRARSTSAVARVDSEVLEIPHAAFRALLDDEPGMARCLLDITAQRLQASSERESALAFMAADARLARVLLHLDRQETERGYVTISQEELAQRTGLTRQTVAGTLGKWRRRGWLVTGRGRIMVLNHARLEDSQ